MNDYIKRLSAFFGIDEEDVVDVDSSLIEKGKVTVFATLRPNFPACPKCGAPDPHRHGNRRITLNNSVIAGIAVEYVVTIQRYRCRECHAVYKDEYSLYSRGDGISKGVKLAIIKDLATLQSYTEIARRYGVSVTEVMLIMGSLKDLPRLTLPRVICVDEFHFTKGRRKNPNGDYPFVISDPEDGTIIDIVESRRMETLREYFRKIPEAERKMVEVVVTDMNDTYRAIIGEFFPKAVHVVDHFHVMKLFSEAMMTVRKRVMKAEKAASNEPGYRTLKNRWRLFQMDKSSLTKIRKADKADGVVYTGWDIVSEALDRWQDLGETFDVKQEFFEFSKRRKKPGEAASWVPFFAQKLSHRTVPEIQAIGKTFANWGKEIAAAYTPDKDGRYYSNAVAEANNNVIQTLMDVGYGYRDFARFRNRVLMINRSPEAVARRKAAKEARKNGKEKAKNRQDSRPE